MLRRIKGRDTNNTGGGVSGPTAWCMGMAAGALLYVISEDCTFVIRYSNTTKAAAGCNVVSHSEPAAPL